MEVSPELIRRIDELVRTNDQFLRDRFFDGLIAFTVVVAVGVFLEFAEHLPIRITRFNEHGWLVVRHGIARWKKRVEWISTLVVLIGLAGEGLFEGLTSRADNILQTFNEVLIGSAQLQAAEADERAADAEATSKGFESQIADSNVRVKEAEARAAEAQSMAESDHLARVKVEEQLARIKLPRSLIKPQDLISTLEEFRGTEYTFSSVFQNTESIDFLKLIDSVLQRAGWNRTKPPAGFPAINVYGADQDFAVPAGFIVGVEISVDDTLPLEVLNSVAIGQLPPLLKAAAVLNLNLNSHTSPKEDPIQPRRVIGTSRVIRIAVGEKPQ